MESIKDILTRWTIESEKRLIENYKSKGLRAAGEFEEKVRHEITDNRSTIFGPPHTPMMVTGRKPNTKQDNESLRKWVGWAGSTFLKDWVADKGLSINSYAVAWNIARDGVKIPNAHNDGRLLKDTFTPENISSLTKEIGRFYAVEISSTIQKAWQQ